MYYEIRRITRETDEVVEVSQNKEEALHMAIWFRNKEIEDGTRAEIRIEAYETYDDAYDDNKVVEIINIFPDHELEIEEV